MVSAIVYPQRFLPPEILNSSSGLSSEYIINSVSSPSGFLYLATKRGISKYDGYRFGTLTSAKAIWSELYLNNEFIYYHDNEGLIQLDCTNDTKSLLINNDFNDQDPNNDHFNNIFVDSKGRIWGSDFNYVKYFSPLDKRLKTFLIDAENKSLDPYSIIEPIKNEVWISSKNGLWIWMEDSGKLQPFPDKGINKKQFSTTYFNKKNGVLLTTQAGEIFEIKPATKQISKRKELPRKEIAKGIFSLNNVLYFYSSKYLYFLENEEYKSLYNAEKNSINSVKADEITGIIWISTDKGLVKLPPLNPGIEILNFPEKESIESIVISIVEDPENNLWLLTDNGTVWNFDKGKWSLRFKNDSIKCFILNKVGDEIILSTNNGLFVWKNNNFEKISIQNPRSDSAIIKILKPSENEVWIVYAHQKIQRFSWPDFQHLEDRFTNEEKFWQDNQWNDIVVDRDDQIWLAGWMPKGFGINKYDPIRHYFEDISEESINKDNSVFVGDYYNRIGFGSVSNLLFSAHGGFNVVEADGKVIKKVDVLNYPILDPHVEGLSQDNKGNIFFATGEGLNVYRPSLDEVVRISKTDGLPSENLLYAYTVLQNGKIALGVSNGIVLINPETILNSHLQNRLVVSQIKINGTVQNNTETHLELSKDQTDLTLYFSNLSFLDPSKVTYQYRFDDSEKWLDLGNNPELSLNRISPGKYNIQIRSQDNFLNTQEKTLTVSVVANPPFFKSNLFYILLMALIIVVVVMIQKYLTKRKQKEAAYLQKIKETEMQMLRSQMNPHFMFNTLNSINSYIIQNKTEDASAYLTTFSKLMRNILQNSKEQSITLENELQTLRLYIELESARLEHSFTYKINVDKDISTASIIVPPLIIQPFVENAIWHGLRNKSEKGNLIISVFKIDENHLKISVKDNGVGRQKSAQLKTNQVSHKSYGMEITIDRLKMLDENNTVQIMDLYDHEKNALGTEVIITLIISEND